MAIRHVAVALIAAAAVVGTAGCESKASGAATPESSSQSTTTESSSAAPTSNAGKPSTAGTGSGKLPDGAPAGFPVPPGVEINGGAYKGKFAMTLKGQPSKKVADFFRSALPAAGYKITKDDSMAMSGGEELVSLAIAGNGYQGKISALGGDFVTVSMEKA